MNHRGFTTLLVAVSLGQGGLLSGCGDDVSESPATASSTTGGGGGTGGAGAAGGIGGAGAAGPTYEDAVRAATWTKIESAPTVSGGAKQDDIFFLDAERGFLASGPTGSIQKTTDGGATWSTVLSTNAAFYRAVLFTNPQNGFVGNIGAGLAPSITDANVIYRTTDGGDTWLPITDIAGPVPEGICNFMAVDEDHIFGVGRANAPAHLVYTSDGGATWTSKDLSNWFLMAIDAHFTSPTEGIVAGMEGNRCTIMRTTDAGTSFEPVFVSETPGSLCWKLDFPSADVGYVAVQDTLAGPGTFGKTTDGGLTWQELPLPTTDGYPAIGVGFINEDIGWMVSAKSSLPAYRTFDGGATWEPEPSLAGPINRLRFVDANTAYAVGASVWRLDVAFDGE